MLIIVRRTKYRNIRYNNDIIEQAKLGNSYISDIKSGRVKHPSAEAVGNISEATGARLEWIINGQGEPFIKELEVKEDEKKEINLFEEQIAEHFKRMGIPNSFKTLLSGFQTQLIGQKNQTLSMINLLDVLIQYEDK